MQPIASDKALAAMNVEAAKISEEEIRQVCRAGDFRAAASLTLQCYRGEMLSFLVWRLRSQSDGEEALAMLAEDLWSGIGAFEWRCTIRTWLYVLARNAAARLMKSSHARIQRNMCDAADEQLAGVLDVERTRTQAYRRTDVKELIRELRKELAPEDQLLLVLRIDRGLSWQELAIAVNGDVALYGEQLKRESARLRQCFQRSKQELRKLAAERGLFRED